MSRVHVAPGARGGATSGDVDVAVRQAALQRQAEQTQAMAIDISADAEHTVRVDMHELVDDATLAATQAAVAPDDGKPASAAQEEPFDVRKYLTEPTTKVVFAEEDAAEDPSAGLGLIDGEYLDQDVTQTRMAPVPVPLEDAVATQAPTPQEAADGPLQTHGPVDEDAQVTQHVTSEAGDAPREPAGTDTAPQKSPANHTRRTVVVVAVLVAVLAVMGVAWYTWRQELWGGVTVPDVEGLSLDDASQRLAADGFVVDAQYQYVDDGDGMVLAMLTPAGQRLPRGSTVSLDVGQLRRVPGVIGMTQDDARAAIDPIGVAGYHIVYENSDQPEGTVIAVDPDVGQAFRSTDTITLTLAQAFVVPDVIGMTEQAARDLLQQNGLTADVRYVESDGQAGTVVSTDPEAGTTVSSGATVTVDVAQPTSSTEAPAGLSDVRHVADYLSAKPEDVASFLAQQGYTLVTGSLADDGSALCTYTKAGADTVCFGPTPRAAATSGAATDVLGKGAGITGVRLELAADYVSSLGGLTDGAVQTVMAACGLGELDAEASSVSVDGSATTSTAIGGHDYVCGVGPAGDDIWCVLLYQDGTAYRGVVTCVPRSYYAGQGQDGYEAMAAGAAQAELAG